MAFSQFVIRFVVFIFCAFFSLGNQLAWAGLDNSSPPAPLEKNLRDRNLSYSEFVQLVSLAKLYVNSAYQVLPKVFPNSEDADQFSALDKSVFDEILRTTKFYPVEGRCAAFNRPQTLVYRRPNSDICFSYSGYKSGFYKEPFRELMVSAILAFSNSLALDNSSIERLGIELMTSWPKTDALLAPLAQQGSLVNLEKPLLTSTHSHNFKTFASTLDLWPTLPALVFGSFLRVYILRDMGAGFERNDVQSNALALIASLPSGMVEKTLMEARVMGVEGPCPGFEEHFGVSIFAPGQACISYQSLRELSDEDFARQARMSVMYTMLRLMGLSSSISKIFAVEYHYGDVAYFKMELSLQKAMGEMLNNLPNDTPEENLDQSPDEIQIPTETVITRDI